MSQLKKQINQLLEQEIDRKQFLQYGFTAFLAAFGVSGLISALVSSSPAKKTSKVEAPTTGSGYSTRDYNG